MIAEQREPHDLMERHLLKHMDGLKGRGHPVGDVRVEECGVFRRDDELHFAQHVERSAAGHAVHRGDHRLPQVARLGTNVGAGIIEHERRRGPPNRTLTGVVFTAHGLGAVDAGAERLVPGSRQNHHAYVVVAPEATPQLVQLALHLRVEGVMNLRTIERHPGHTGLFLVQKRLVLLCHDLPRAGSSELVVHFQ